MLRVKIYWKTLQLLQSESVTKSVGMNTKAMFYPTMRMGQALIESREEGQTRIEITYSAASKLAEDEILNGVFYLRAKIDLDRAERALNSVDRLGWHLPLQKLFDEFVESSRKMQLLIIQPSLVAMIYASNDKPGCFTGHLQVRTPDKHFDHMTFIAAHAQPGPGSFVTCIIEPHGNLGFTNYMVLEKTTTLSQIPGLRYRPKLISNLPRPSTWDKAPLTEATLNSVKVTVVDHAVHDPLVPILKDEALDAMST